MNTRKQVLIMTTLLLAMLMLVGAYAAWLPSRSTSAGEEFGLLTAERGAIIFSQNCRLCHGDIGEGGALGGRLPAAPALDRLDLQGFIDSKLTTSAAVNATTETIPVGDTSKLSAAKVKTIAIDDERMDIKKYDGNNLIVERGAGHSDAAAHDAKAPILMLDKDTLALKQTYITNTITCGHVGTAMQAWAQTQGGTLSAEQIRQLMTLITENRWDLVPHNNDHTDLIVTHLTEPATADATSLRFSDISVFTKDQYLRIGDERILIVSVPNIKDANGNLPKDRSGAITVTRGVKGSAPLDHDVEAEIFNFPVAPTPSINQASCGQTAQAPTVAGTPELIEPFTGDTINVVASGIAFDQKTITAKAGAQLRVRLDNKDAATEHNIAFYKSSTDITPVATGSVGLKFPGPGVDDTVFTAPAAGTYFFRCDVHPAIPAMTGTFTVTP
jgi:plastocyanin